MQLSALPQSTTDRLANVRRHEDASQSGLAVRNASSSRVTSQTISSMQKASDSSLRSSKINLPTIAGSPSTNSGSSATLGSKPLMRESKLPPGASQSAPSSGSALSALSKETPTRIPRIASRSSTVTSPALKGSSSFLSSRRTSLVVGSTGHDFEGIDSNAEDALNEFGVLETGDEATDNQDFTISQKTASRVSPVSMHRTPRHNGGFSATTSSSGVPIRKTTQTSVTTRGLRKSSTGSVSSITTSVPASDQQGAFSVLSPSKGLNKLLSPKISKPTSRLSGSATTPNLGNQSAPPTPRRQSLSTPSPVPSSVDEDEILGDEEMMQYIKRTQARKLAHGAKKSELDDLLKFPEPIPPGRPHSPTSEFSESWYMPITNFFRHC